MSTVLTAVGQKILDQLGDRKFKYMTAASSFTSDETSLSFRVPARSAKKNIKGVIIRLCSDDTYSIETIKQRPKPTFEIYRVDFVEGIYNNQLREVFTRITGLYVSL